MIQILSRFRQPAQTDNT